MMANEDSKIGFVSTVKLIRWWY